MTPCILCRRPEESRTNVYYCLNLVSEELTLYLVTSYGTTRFT